MNKKLIKAKQVKNDEFYTLYEDIEKEMSYYAPYLKGKVILCPCDSNDSNFYKYFKDNFDKLGLKKLITVCYNADGKGVKRVITANGEDVVILQGNGDFRNQETIDLLEESDIVVTNPPFSLFRDFINLMMTNDCEFHVVGCKNSLVCKELFTLRKDCKYWFGKTNPSQFIQPDGSITDNMAGLTRWYSTIPAAKSDAVFDSGMTYEQGKAKGLYQIYDNYNAINTNAVNHIPMDYAGVIGVPITYLYHYNPNQYTIVGFRKGNDGKELKVNGKEKFGRVLIQRCSVLL